MALAWRSSLRRFSSLVRNYPSGVAKELPCTPAPLTPKLMEKNLEISALRTKEMGSWKELTVEEKVTRKFGMFVNQLLKKCTDTHAIIHRTV